jgi:nitrogen fixation/metabolism regulation signal transduction histidine kinase
MRWSRFERKILVAMGAVALVPLLGALLLGQRVLREAYEVGVNPRVGSQLEQGLELRRAHLALLRQGGKDVAAALASDHELVAAALSGDGHAARERLQLLLDRHPSLARARLTSAAGKELGYAELPERIGPAFRLLELSGPLDGEPSPGDIAVTVAAPADVFADYQRAGELFEVYERLERESGLVSGYYLVVYIGFLLSVIVAALAVGVVISRRVTRRVSLVAEATERVGRGDLAVQVETVVDDEIGDLTKAFNAMVRDLRESRGRIEYLQRISAWQEFARRLAHEIKNPLTPIQLAMQEVHKSYPGGDPAYQKRVSEAAAIVEEEVATLRRLVSEFSAFARLPEASLEPADMGELLREAARNFPAMLEELSAVGRIEILCTPPKEPLPVDVDAMMFKRALDNLVRNAVQALRQDASRERGRVWVSARRQGKHVELVVEDDGPGIAEPDRARVFDPYYTTKSEGTGLGLAIVKKVVLEHRGQIECLQGEHGGARFAIELPTRG